MSTLGSVEIRESTKPTEEAFHQNYEKQQKVSSTKWLVLLCVITK
jgi:hypothetical protein